MAADTIERRLPLPEASSSCGLSFLLHGLLVLAAVYAPQWLHGGKPFKAPVSYEVTLVSSQETGGKQKADPPLQMGQKVASATAKAAARPGDVLTLPSPPRSSMSRMAGRPFSAPTQTEAMTLPGRHRASERQPAAPPAIPPGPPRIVAPQVAVPTISQPVMTSPVGDVSKAGAGHGLSMATETGVMVGNTDPALAYYFVLIQDKITSSWTPPKMSPGTTAGVSLTLRILRSGQIRDLIVGSSSGDRLLDDTAVRAIALASPLPPLPPLFKAETLLLELRFTFVGEKS
ncbi:MAG: TonB C-terminal domain-containing protein [bacterium]|uniref:TonB C-terminal domain-containing protein n=1 Tax=Candidatus Methylomirabilis tolerans TaxID=3123416 RepID=A0AAJ1EJB4_9BACT|nr:TonB C-terminal domain-containing protein [Candidatus Methylomirabilis sp.]